jgi:predicted PurR-regulated permease PerM
VAQKSNTAGFLQRTGMALGLAATLGLGLVVLWHAAIVPLLFFAGILLAIALDAPAQWVSRHSPLTRFWSTAAVLVLAVVLVAVFALLAGPAVGQQFDQLSRQLPQSLADLRDRIETTQWGRAALHSFSRESAGQVVSPTQAVEQATRALASATWAITAFVVVLFTGLYLAFQPRLYVRGALRLAPPGRRRRLEQVLSAMGRALRWWLLGRLATMAVDGVLIALGLWLLGVPLAMVLGLLAAVLAFIPNLGPILSFIPAALIALSDGPQMVLWVALIYLGAQFLESYAVTPVIDRKVVSLPPALLLMAQVLMGLLAGVLGLFVAGPLAVVAIVAVQMLYLEDILGERVKVLGARTSGEPVSAEGE